jgi:hypothetical protein
MEHCSPFPDQITTIIWIISTTSSCTRIPLELTRVSVLVRRSIFLEACRIPDSVLNLGIQYGFREVD